MHRGHTNSSASYVPLLVTAFFISLIEMRSTTPHLELILLSHDNLENLETVHLHYFRNC